MTELINAAFLPINIGYTILLMFVMLYWITVFLGFLDLSSLDFDMDTDVDMDADVDVDVDADVDLDADADVDADTGGVSPVLAVLAFFNIGKVPFMIFLSFLALFLWTGSVLGNHYLGGDQANFALILLVPNLLIGLFLTKLATTPLKAVFKDEELEFKNHQDLIGTVGVAVYSIEDHEVSQIRIPSRHGSSLLLRVKATDGNLIAKGQKGLIVHYDEEAKVYFAEPFID